jgi:hypothetical protein
MVRAAFIALLLGGLGVGWLGACSGKTVGEEGGDGGDSSMPPTKPSPVVQCQTYASTWCTKAFGCYVQVGRLEQESLQYNVDQCKKIVADKLPCSAATSTSSDFDTCITQIKGMACSKWDIPETQFGTVIPPTSCNDALLFGE